MMINQPKYDLKDVTIMPNASQLTSTSLPISICMEDGMLPIFTRPSTDMVNPNYFECWKVEEIIPIVPQISEKVDDITTYIINGNWIVVSRETVRWLRENKLTVRRTVETRDKYNNLGHPELKIYLKAENGHSTTVLNELKHLKDDYATIGIKVVVMCGNIYSPSVYFEYAKYGIDYVCVGIGDDENAQDAGVYYPQASLLREVYGNKKYVEQSIYSNSLNNKKSVYITTPKIVADGEIYCISNIVKSLGLGADYVMVGELIESKMECQTPNKSRIYKLTECIKTAMVMHGVSDIYDFIGQPTFVAHK